MAIDSVNPPENRESASVDASERFPVGKTAHFTTGKGGSSKWATIAEETKHTSRTLDALDLAGRTTGEEARVKVSRSLAALDLAISKVQEAKMNQTSFTADLLVKKTNERTVAVGKEARKALQPAREAIDSKRFEKTPTHAPSAPTKAPTPKEQPQSGHIPTLTR